MADYLAIGPVAASISAGGVAIPRTTPQQILITSPEELQWQKEGRVYSTSGATILDTAETVTATAIVRQQPFLFLRVPQNVVCVPLNVFMMFKATGAAVNQTLISSSANDMGVANSVAAVTANVNTRYAGIPSKVAAYATNTGATGTAPSGVADLWRSYMQADQDAITGAPTPPIIYNPSQGLGTRATIGSSSAITNFAIYLANGTSSTAFVICTWAEFTFAEFYGGA